MTAETVAPYRWSREQYDRAVEAGVFGEQRIELLDGEIVSMPPQGSPHASTTRWLRTELVCGLDRTIWLVGSHEPFALSDWSEPEPDVWVARIADVVGRTHPGTTAMTVVVEVSWSSSWHDRVRKLPLYGRAGVPEYWIVDLQREVVHVHRGPSGDGYRQVTTAGRGDVLTVPETDMTIDVDELLGPVS